MIVASMGLLWPMLAIFLREYGGSSRLTGGKYICKKIAKKDWLMFCNMSVIAYFCRVLLGVSADYCFASAK